MWIFIFACGNSSLNVDFLSIHENIYLCIAYLIVTESTCIRVCMCIYIYSWDTHPSPVRAQQPWMCQGWSFMEVKFRCCEISAADIEPFTSCLLAKIKMAAFLRSWKPIKKHLLFYKTLFVVNESAYT